MKKDITEKLNFEEKPALVIKDQEIEVNNDAPSVLKVMSIMSDAPGTKEIMKAYETVFAEESRKKLEGLNLSFKDLVTVINEAIDLILSGDKAGEV